MNFAPDKYSTKEWRHKTEISEIMGFVRIFWKNNVQEAYLPKMSISGQIVSEIVAQLCLETLLNFCGSTHFYDVVTIVIYRQVIEGEGKGGKLDARDLDGWKAAPLHWCTS